VPFDKLIFYVLRTEVIQEVNIRCRSDYNYETIDASQCRHTKNSFI